MASMFENDGTLYTSTSTTCILSNHNINLLFWLLWNIIFIFSWSTHKVDYNKSYEFLKDIMEGWVQKGPHQRPYKFTGRWLSLFPVCWLAGRGWTCPRWCSPGPRTGPPAPRCRGGRRLVCSNLTYICFDIHNDWRRIIIYLIICNDT